MNNSVIPFPEEPSDRASEEEARLRAAAQALLDAVAAEPVPDRLRHLAAELGRALEEQRRAQTAPKPTDDAPRSDNSPIG